MIHDKALVEDGALIGERSNVWAFTHILSGAKIGLDCNICDHVFIENNVIIGNRVTVKSGVQLWDGIIIEDDVFIGPNVTFTNDRFPRSKHRPDRFLTTVVQRNASIGANATILPGVEIGCNAMVGAGAVVVKNVPANTIVVGNPAKIIGYTENARHPPGNISSTRLTDPGRIVRFKQISDMRGDLTEIDFRSHLPFLPARVFVVSGVPSEQIRGEHAHRRCSQLLVATSGSVRVMLDNGEKRRQYSLSSQCEGLFIPPMVWGTQFNYSLDAVLMVFASHSYDAADYIRDYGQFLEEIGSANGPIS